MTRPGIQPKRRPSTPEERAWYAKVAKIPACVLCGSTGALQIAHENLGKGMGVKAPYERTARLCVRCHTTLDNGSRLTLDERRRLLAHAVDKTHEWLRMMGEIE